MPARPGGDRVHDARIQRPVGDQRSAALFRHADELLFHRLLVDVAEVNVEELHAADLLQLLLHPATGFQGVLQAAAHGLLVVLLVGVEQLQQAGDGVLDGNAELAALIGTLTCGNSNVLTCIYCAHFCRIHSTSKSTPNVCAHFA